MSFNTFAVNGGPGDGDRDTVNATVEYGEALLFPKNSFYSYKINDILNVCERVELPQEKAEDKAFFIKTITSSSVKKINRTIDSLASLDLPNYALINELSNYLRNRPRYSIVDSSVVNQNNTAYPAHSIYQSWNAHIAFEANETPEERVDLILVNHETNCDFAHPLCEKSMYKYYGKITSPFGWRDGRNHNGVDLELHQWDSVYSMFAGVVRFSKRYAGYGKVVVVRHYNGLETLYAHLSRINVNHGDIVEPGDLIGFGGQTGNARGTHLHMEIRYKNIPVNPEHIIKFDEKQLLAEKVTLKLTNRGYIAVPFGAKTHIVERGEYLSKIASRYGISLTELCTLNNISRKKRLKVGDELIVKY